MPGSSRIFAPPSAPGVLATTAVQPWMWSLRWSPGRTPDLAPGYLVLPGNRTVGLPLRFKPVPLLQPGVDSDGSG